MQCHLVMSLQPCAKNLITFLCFGILFWMLDRVGRRHELPAMRRQAKALIALGQRKYEISIVLYMLLSLSSQNS